MPRCAAGPSSQNILAHPLKVTGFPGKGGRGCDVIQGSRQSFLRLPAAWCRPPGDRGGRGGSATGHACPIRVSTLLTLPRTAYIYIYIYIYIYSYVGIVPDDAVGRRVFSAISRSPLLIPALFRTQSPISALKTSILRAVHISSLTFESQVCCSVVEIQNKSGHASAPTLLALRRRAYFCTPPPPTPLANSLELPARGMSAPGHSPETPADRLQLRAPSLVTVPDAPLLHTPAYGLFTIQNHEISLVQHFYIGAKIKLDPGSELGSFDLGSGKMLHSFVGGKVGGGLCRRREGGKPREACWRYTHQTDDIALCYRAAQLTLFGQVIFTRGATLAKPLSAAVTTELENPDPFVQKRYHASSPSPPPPPGAGWRTSECFQALSCTEEERAALLARPSAVWWLLLAASSASHSLAPSIRLSAIPTASLTFPSRVFAPSNCAVFLIELSRLADDRSCLYHFVLRGFSMLDAFLRNTEQVAQGRGIGEGLQRNRPWPIPAFTWSDFVKQWKTEIRMAGPGTEPWSSRMRFQ
ncbi:hypothetical protein PR048_032499 [Dryococelus australis]|uniref:Uncharacterized protein n=1 Tax=Dryococelus australis TaxID=614101 RepID=A0ABQ9G6G7_9NEOP|nr:hypothetical protein PR048_032499 [Dryococelus australis]